MQQTKIPATFLYLNSRVQGLSPRIVYSMLICNLFFWLHIALCLGYGHQLSRGEICVANFTPLQIERVGFFISCQKCDFSLKHIYFTSPEIIEFKIHYRQRNRQTDKFFDNHITGYADFFFHLNLLPPHSFRSQGNNFL